MSPADERFWTNATRAASSLTPDMALAIVRAYRILRDSLTEAELARVIDSGRLDVLLAQVISDAVLGRAFLPIRLRIRDTVSSGFRYTLPALPKGGRINGVVAVSFDTLSPNVITAIRSLETQAFSTFSGDVRETIRAFVENGLRDGTAPRTIARSIRDVVGLAPNQVEIIGNYRAALEAGQSVTGYTLRDKRLATNTPAQIEKAVAAYQRKMNAFHAETVARTSVLDAFKEGQRLAWEDAIEQGTVSRDRLRKKWVGVLDDRERPEHRAVEGETVPFDSPFSTGEQVPGSSTYNCRCLARMFLA